VKEWSLNEGNTERNSLSFSYSIGEKKRADLLPGKKGTARRASHQGRASTLPFLRGEKKSDNPSWEGKRRMGKAR